MTTAPAVRYEVDRDEHLALITIDRPEARNAVNGAVAEGIEAAIDAVEADPQVWVAVLTGAPPAFCAGADLREIRAGNTRCLTTRRGGLAGIVRREHATPIIAAVEGPALAAGTEIVLACDLVVASTTATFGLVEVKRSNVAAGGGLFRLPRRIPLVKAMEWALTGDTFPAPVAAELGLVNEVCPAGQAVTRARALAARITANAPLAVQLSRTVVLDTAYAPDEVGWERSRAAVRSVAATDDFREGVHAFLERRDPRWTGS
ncbi:short chain enoyl-CoA hydratase [Jatrophihabitans endophyticus]|uniref:Short chain enoyl-CoA hydratase n=1 Tax=Jatrophihabitans endophyticus TaxID=1206085 RepID=A0A1M5PUB3_9ACTN|nr:crotonase/enoyl-CoA hydratase family protein [Jatrophihabitans endophyticus]SHH05201.1 short chain enoyl-CoA hydratase [Jatrophihabitans endophyticus]